MERKTWDISKTPGTKLYVQGAEPAADEQPTPLISPQGHTLAPCWFGMAPWIWLTLISWLLPWIHACCHDTVDNGCIHADFQISPAPCHLSRAINFTCIPIPTPTSPPSPSWLPSYNLHPVWLLDPCKSSHEWLCGPRRTSYMYFPIHKVKYKIN